MIVKFQGLKSHLMRSKEQIYVLSGDEPFLMDESIRLIKQHKIKNEPLSDYKLEVNTTEEWQTVFQIQQQYELWSDKKWIELLFQKKNIDKLTQSYIQTLFKQHDPDSFLILKSPLCDIQAWSKLLHLTPFNLIQLAPLSTEAMKQWIKTALDPYQYPSDLVELIYYYTEGSLRACQQLFEKLSIIYDEQAVIQTKDILPHLYDQRQYHRFALSEACLAGDINKAIHILRYTPPNEFVLVLWVITQEIRTLLKLKHEVKQKNMQDAFRTLNLWAQKIPLYQQALTVLSEETLWNALQDAQQIDIALKAHQTLPSIADRLEQLLTVFRRTD